MQSRELATPFRRLAFLGDFVRPRRTPLQEVTSPLLKEPLSRDKTLHFFYLVANFCINSRFEELAGPEIKWPRSLQPTRSFETSVLSPSDLRRELQEGLGLKSGRDDLKVYFGFRWADLQEDQILEIDNFYPRHALLIVAEEKCSHAVILGAVSKEGEKWETTATVFSPGKAKEFSELDISPRKLGRLLAETAELAIRCAELELRSKNTP